MTSRASSHSLAGAPSRDDDDPVLSIEHLSVRLPGGGRLLDGVGLEVRRGEALVLVGPSGAGKSTLLRALFDPDAMRDEGFTIESRAIVIDGSLGLVPQRGALFDHLDAAGNVELALRYADAPSGSSSALTPALSDSPSGRTRTEQRARKTAADRDVAAWLDVVDLDTAWATTRKPVGELSGGQAQRLAVVRALASGRRVLFLDEPTTGLDPVRVARLAEQLRALADDESIALVAVTHDTAFASALADRVVLLRDRHLAPIELPGRPPTGVRSGDVLERTRKRLEEELHRAIEDASPRDEPRDDRRLARTLLWAYRAWLAPFSIGARAAMSAALHVARRPRDFAHVAVHALRQSLIRPLLFYLIVSFLLGATVLYVLTTFGGDFGPGEAVRIVRGLPMIALTPPLSAFLFVAASANAVNAWLGGMRLSRQVTALEALGIPRAHYLWGPCWAALVLAYLLVAALFAFGFLAGSLALCGFYRIDGAWYLLTSDLFDPVPERAPYRIRAVAIVVFYAIGIASDAVSRADEPKEEADHVTRAMTRSVVACTLWVAIVELVSLVLLRNLTGGASPF
ncbi:MAG: ATP-binding cassette domain-containing protein [Deltaproteobacteria bacterium]|nr:ATP-binding cassette domain-containing protein [Deltaproteobacteria bacterium]